MFSLCFQEAFVKRRENVITEDEFLKALVNHCTGIRHGKNRLCNNDTPLPENLRLFAFGGNIEDPFTKSVAQWILLNFKKPVTGNIF
jgi:hypothetical protein